MHARGILGVRDMLKLRIEFRINGVLHMSVGQIEHGSFLSCIRKAFYNSNIEGITLGTITLTSFDQHTARYNCHNVISGEWINTKVTDITDKDKRLPLNLRSF